MGAFGDASVFNWVGFDQQQTLGSHAAPVRIKPQTSSSVMSHLAQAREAVADLNRRQHRTERDLRNQQALEWLSENRQKYAGQWIAVRGATGRNR